MPPSGADAVTHMPSASRRAVTLARSILGNRAVPLVIGLALVAALVLISHPAEIWRTIRQTSPAAVVAAVAMNVPIVLLRLARAAVVLRHAGHRVPFRSLLEVQLVGQTSSSVTPASSGDYLRAYLWRRTAGVPLRAGAAVVMFERLFSFGLMIAAAIALVVFLRYGPAGWVAIAVVMAAATVAPFVLERAAPRLERWALARVTSGRRLSRYAEGALGMADNLRDMIGSLPLLVRASALTVVIFALSGLQVWLLMAGLGIRVGVAQATAVYTTSQVGGTISTVPFGIGSMDAVMVTVLASYGVTVAASATVAVLMRGTSTLPQAVAGLIAYWDLNRSAEKAPAEEVVAS